MRKDGEKIEVVANCSSIRDDDGRIIGFLEIIRDLSVQKKYEEAESRRLALEEKKRMLEQQKEAQSVFISNVSHELRTPLTSIHGYSSLLKEGEAGRLTEQQREFIEIINSETNRLTRLINDILDFSKMQSKRFKINPQLFDLRAITERSSCKSLAERKGLYVKWEIAPETPQVYGDPSRVSQILINLISNAIKFTQAGGITIRVAPKGRSFVQIDVIDTGIGISEEDQKTLFRRFSQVQPTAGSDAAKPEGTGLGLAITKELVRLHGGKIWVKSEPGKGSVFSFTLRTSAPKTRAAKKDAQK